MKRISLFALACASLIVLFASAQPAESETTPRLVIFESFFRPST